MGLRIIGIIPARFASTRFPGKPLVDIAGKSMIMRVYEQAKKASLLTDVIVATDDDRIFNHVEEHGGKVMMTATTHQNGTERCAEVAEQFKAEADAFINIQGDEPCIHPEQINQVAKLLMQQGVQIATLQKKIEDTSLLQNPTIIKVVSTGGKAHYFSRSAIPFFRNDCFDNWLKQHTYFKHIGIYGFQKDVLLNVVKLLPSPLEMAEQLEQLRWLENGYTIHLGETTQESYSVDVETDLGNILKLL
ncbi:MAG: 3-deoxy-manno-octulosonate cytidylyltransferase [Chitinophagales bacterium]